MYMQSSEISCDLCGEAEFMQETCKDLRLILKGFGWINRGSKDYCPKCKNEQSAKNKESNFNTGMEKL